MFDWTNIDHARVALADPQLPAAELASIATLHRELWPQISAHPAAYPELLEWLSCRAAEAPGPDEAPPPAVRPQPPRHAASPSQHMSGPASPTTASSAPSPSSSGGSHAPQGVWLGAGSPSSAPLPQLPGKAKTRVRHGKPAALIAAGAVVLALILGLGVWVLTQGLPGAGKPTAARTVAPGEAPTVAPRPVTADAVPESDSPETPTRESSAPPADTGTDGEVSVIPDESPVAIAPGEKHFSGTASLAGVKNVPVGFIRSADGQSIRAVTVAIDDAGFLKTYGPFAKYTVTAMDQSFEVDGGQVEAKVGDGVILNLTLGTDTATGTLSFRSEIGGFADVKKSTMDLGSGPVNLAAR